MSVTLTALIRCEFSREELFDLPKLLNEVSSQSIKSVWSWYECAPPEQIDINNFESLIEEGYLWLNSSGGFYIMPNRESLCVDCTIRYSQFFSDGERVKRFIEFCTALAEKCNCNTIYFMPDQMSMDMNYEQVSIKINDGYFSSACESKRMLGSYEYDVYCKYIEKASI